MGDENKQGLSAAEFRTAVGNDDWAVTDGMARTTFSTGSFAVGVQLVDEIGRLADAANHHPDVDLRYPHVTISLVTHDEGTSITDKDVALARQISAAAQRMGVSATP